MNRYIVDKRAQQGTTRFLELNTLGYEKPYFHAMMLFLLPFSNALRELASINASSDPIIVISDKFYPLAKAFLPALPKKVVPEGSTLVLGPGSVISVRYRACDMRHGVWLDMPCLRACALSLRALYSSLHARSPTKPQGLTGKNRPGRYYILVVQRSGTRVIMNIAKLIQTLTGMITNAEILIDDGLNFIDKLKLFYLADVVIFYHGAAASNILFSKDGALILEITCYDTARISERADNQMSISMGLNASPTPISIWRTNRIVGTIHGKVCFSVYLVPLRTSVVNLGANFPGFNTSIRSFNEKIKRKNVTLNDDDILGIGLYIHFFLKGKTVCMPVLSRFDVG
eukprot:CAMPEP_0202365354 /NCGR_PEP_ID=MMETSP1126-20121109/16394_1 /ASSEMBLY_ACC=CAM_ASM_000457 /TAXON_ID=3047 /ORGANISM="Dunaliella tertiolecta, Strain CCMP1320" /LENGTH=342 /DNA_ID=CAMNT_0048960177 /DNA_START=469 /DNA_END=1500 /DNA_ORIENTATION=-